MIIFNVPGLLISVGAFVIVAGLGKLVGLEDRDILMVAGGVLVIAGDLTYQLARNGGHWIDPKRGGSLFLMPLWCLGVFWVGLGIAKSFGLVQTA